MTARLSPATLLGVAPEVRAIAYRDKRGQFWPCLLTRDERALTLREIAFRPGHGARLRKCGGPDRRLGRAVWILERVYENHAHWLTAHLPKLCLLKALGETAPIVLPSRRNATIDASLAMLGIDPQAHPHFDADGPPLAAEEMLVFSLDRLRPELLRLVRDTFAPPLQVAPWRRIYVSRARARGRRYLEEEALWPMLRDAGFERVFLEDFSFADEIALMRETKILMGPHGAGLSNMIFCAPGAHVIEIGDCGFPCPDFCAMAGALGLRHWLLRARSVGRPAAAARSLRHPAWLCAHFARDRSAWLSVGGLGR